MIEARRYLISGHVQGVGFRFFAQDAAGHEGLGGFVRNLPEGQVEIVAEGEGEALDRFERSLRRGPAGARVGAIETEILPPTGHRGGFIVR
jgi:acylphosphatase